MEGFELFGDVFLVWTSFEWGLRSFVSVALVSIAFSLAIYVAARRSIGTEQTARSAIGMLFVIGIFGGLVGFHGGNSRDAVVGELLPAVITLVAGVAAYLFGVSDKKPNAMLFPMVASFIFVVFVTYGMGSANRSSNAYNERWEEFCVSAYAADVFATEETFRRAELVFKDSCTDYLYSYEASGEEGFAD